MAQVTKGPASGIGATIGYGSRPSEVHKALEGVPEDQLLTMNLNGREVKAKAGETIMEVCHREDTYVPHYCWHPSLSIAGNCRLCLVEVEKVPKPVIACQAQVSPGMTVRTQSEVAKSSQEWMMEFLLVNHPLDCHICDRGGECQLQRYSMEYGTGHTRMADKKRKFIKPQADPLIDIERNRCIMCTRCVRFCDEVGGEHVMGVFARGNENYIGTFGQGPVSNIFSGNVIDLCPVGCLTSKPFRFRARNWELQQTQTTCSLCSSGCKVTSWTRNNKLYRTTPPSRQMHDRYTINEDTEEFICNQGRFGSDYSLHESRQDECLAIRAERHTPVAWQKAIPEAAEKLRAIVEEHGPDAVAVLVSPAATNEEGFLARRLAKDVLGTWNIDWRTSFASGAAADAVSAALHVADGDLEQDPDVIVLINGDTVHQSPVLAQRLQEIARRLNKTVISIGHHHGDYLAKYAKHRFHNQPGQTADVLSAIAAAVAGEKDSSALASALNASKEEAEALIEALKGAERGLIVQNLEDFRGLYAPAEVPAGTALRSALGTGWGYLPVVMDRNAVGLNGLGVEPADRGVRAADLVQEIRDGHIKGLFVLGADALAGLRDQHLVHMALENLETFVVADLFDSDYAKAADVFLALSGQLETDGTLFDIEGNIALNKAGIEQVGDSLQGWQILSALGRALEAGPDFGSETAEGVWEQVRAELANESDATLDALELDGSTTPNHLVVRKPLGGARNRSPEYNPGNYRKDGLHLRAAEFLPHEANGSSAVPAPPSAGDNFLLTWGPHVSGHGFRTDRASIAEILLPKPWVQINPADAERIGAKSDQFAVITVDGEKAKVAVRVSDAPAPGCLYMSAGVYGPFDPAKNPGPAVVSIELLDEQVPDQGSAIVSADKAVEEPQETH